MLQIPVKVCRQRILQHGNRMVPQVEVQWSGAPSEQATWEDLENLRQQFPFAPTWGQAGIQAEGIVNDQEDASTTPGEEEEGSPKTDRPKRKKRSLAWLSRIDWVV
jgi:hypothetical protein